MKSWFYSFACSATFEWLQRAILTWVQSVLPSWLKNTNTNASNKVEYFHSLVVRASWLSTIIASRLHSFDMKHLLVRVFVQDVSSSSLSSSLASILLEIDSWLSMFPSPICRQATSRVSCFRLLTEATSVDWGYYGSATSCTMESIDDLVRKGVDDTIRMFCDSYDTCKFKSLQYGGAECVKFTVASQIFLTKMPT